PLPAEEDDSPRENAAAAQNAAPPPPADIPFDLDSLLNPGADVSAFLEDTDTRDEEEPKIEPPAPPPGPGSSSTGSAADARLPENKQTAPRELSAELDDILAAAGEPDLPEDLSPQQLPEKEEAPPAEAEELPESQPPAEAPAGDSPARTQEVQPAVEFAGPVEKSLDSDGWPPADDAVAERALPVEKNSALFPAPAECMPETIQEARQDPTEAVAPETAMTETLPEGTSTPLSADRLLEAENRLDALEKSLAEIAAPESLSRLADRLLEAENRLDALEKNLAEIARASDLEAFEQRLTALESAAPAPKEERPAPVEEKIQAMHAYMELAARLDGTETRLNAAAELTTRVNRIELRLNAFAELATRVDDMETRLNAVTEQFETRVEKAAAAAAAKLLREEIAKLLAS
ncbi:MAG: hypothetical protein LBB66_10165, partial [Desulfovibrio sp.]|nr:hypothetical protein [Desulfovibrio sp.]